MACDEDGSAVVGVVAELVDDGVGPATVEAGGGLVGHDGGCAAEQGSHEGDALALASGGLVWAPGQSGAQAEVGEELFGLGAVGAHRAAAVGQVRQQGVLEECQLVDQPGALVEVGRVDRVAAATAATPTNPTANTRSRAISQLPSHA